MSENQHLKHSKSSAQVSFGKRSSLKSTRSQEFITQTSSSSKQLNQPQEHSLICPICNDEMVSLLQLNQHIDDTHKDTNDPSDYLKQFWKKTTRNFNQGLQNIKSSFNEHDNFYSPEVNKSRLNHEQEVFSTAHFQKDTGNDPCSEKSCSRIVGIIHGKVHCALCGKLFCDLHSRYRTRVNKFAKHDPEGIWVRVCENSYKSREVYTDNNGIIRNHTSSFIEIRKSRIDRLLLDNNLVEKRLEKLSIIYSNENIPANDSLLPAFLQKSKRLDQSVVTWQNDNLKNCQKCLKQFTLTIRKHHCRLCGSLICGRQTCLFNIELTIQNQTGSFPIIKVCKTCNGAIERRKILNVHLLNIPPLVLFYQEMQKLKNIIIESLPEFNELLMELSHRKKDISYDKMYKTALSCRKTLLEYFSRLDQLGKKIRGLPTTMPIAQKLQDNIYFSIIFFLQNHMFTLQLLPSIDAEKEDSHSLSSDEKLQIESLKREITVLKEQSKQVEAYLVDATGRRKFEDAQMLKDSLDELILEIARKTKELQDYGVSIQ